MSPAASQPAIRTKAKQIVMDGLADNKILKHNLGVDLAFSSTSTITSYHNHLHHQNCTKSERIRIKKGCEIIDKRCHCWPTLKVCRNQVNTGSGSRILRWHFKTLEDCQVNLVSLIKTELDFDEDYTIAPNLFSHKKTRRRKKFRTK
uniref:Uncharacterized protein n=1 Tax=Musca domestica TaxID=7370 RepID=A0A1I8NKL1_MUSDO